VDPKQFLARLKSLGSALSPAQMATIGGAFVVVVLVVVGSAYWLSSSDYALLFSDMDAESAADVVSKLKAQKVPYQLEPGGRAIRVPASRVDELRLELTGQGLPASGRVGFEIFDRTAFGATEFLEQVNYRRALEGEIARTIATLSEVGSARVHVAPAKDSLFGAQEQPAKASVVLKLKNANRPLSAASVRGITSLVAASIEGLRPEAVVIVDSFGRPLTRPMESEDGPLDGVQMERQQRIERDLTAKVVALLEPVVGTDRVRVNVSARINPQSQEETEERWDPTSPVIRSRQTTQDGVAGMAGGQGIAGARANLPAVPTTTPAAAAPGSAAAAATPPAGAPPPGAASPAAGATPAVVTASAPVAAGAGRMSDVTNYEISRVTRHTIKPRGDVARLSVAVIVDDDVVVGKDKAGRVTRKSQARQPAELQKIQGLVATAVGIDSTRGDQLTVENVSFDTSASEEPTPPSFIERYGDGFRETGKVFVVLVLGLIAFLMVVRPLMRRSLGSVPLPQVREVLPQQLPKTVEQLQGEIEAQLQAAEAQAGAPRKMTVLTKRLTGMAQKEPETAARLVRTWLAEEEGR
jgi:flagellar M-ring protein FliF